MSPALTLCVHRAWGLAKCGEMCKSCVFSVVFMLRNSQDSPPPRAPQKGGKAVVMVMVMVMAVVVVEATATSSVLPLRFPIAPCNPSSPTAASNHIATPRSTANPSCRRPRLLVLCSCARQAKESPEASSQSSRSKETEETTDPAPRLRSKATRANVTEIDP
jgi:hypothetical protein